MALRLGDGARRVGDAMCAAAALARRADVGGARPRAAPTGVRARVRVAVAHIGIHCGKSKIGCPVKIERLGKYDLQGLSESDPDYRKKFNQFYLSLIEFLQQRLDRLSLEEGRLVQTYEIFDLQGLGYHMVTMTVINFTKDILLNYSAHCAPHPDPNRPPRAAAPPRRARRRAAAPPQTRPPSARLQWSTRRRGCRACGA